MDIPYLIQVLQNKLTVLSNAKGQAFSLGNLESINAIDRDIFDTQNTLAQLNLLAQITAAAAAANTTPTDVVASAVDAAQNSTPAVQGPSASAVVNGYDISAYAADPLYEQKIQAIIVAMPTFASASDVDTYIQAIAPGAPVTGAMVLDSASRYNVNVPLLIAIMQNDSQFGTLGIAVTTFNPGNVGNTGYATKTYPTWADGVAAVANWLNNHLASTVPAPAVVPPPATPVVSTPVPETTASATSTPIVATSTPAVASTTPSTAATSTPSH